MDIGLYEEDGNQVCLSITSFPTPAQDVLSLFQLTLRSSGQREMGFDTLPVLNHLTNSKTSRCCHSQKQGNSQTVSCVRVKPTTKISSIMNRIYSALNVGRRT